MTRQDAIGILNEDLKWAEQNKYPYISGQKQEALKTAIEALKQEPRPIGLCKDCKYFEYDSVAKVDGIPLIVAHEICNKWGNGCKSREDGYCFLFEPQESEVEDG